jgi:hypothetical protein
MRKRRSSVHALKNNYNFHNNERVTGIETEMSMIAYRQQNKYTLSNNKTHFRNEIIYNCGRRTLKL